MKKTDILIMPQFFDRYIHLVEDIELTEALQKYAENSWEDKIDILNQLGDTRYAPDKWTVKDILQHIIDNERIQSYRALAFARGEKASLPGYDEVLYGANAQTARRTVNDLLLELALVRKSTLALFESFDDKMLLQEGIAFNVQISVLALGFMMVGHQIHHFKVMEERYFPLYK